MLNIPAGMGLASIELKVDGDNEPMFTTLGVRAISGPLGQNHARRILFAFRDSLLTALGSTTALHAVQLRVRQDGGGDIVHEERLGVPAGSGGTAAAHPQNVAYIIRKRSLRAGRRGTGRMYLPGVPEANTDQAGNVSSGALTFLTQECTDFLTLLLTDAAGPPVLSAVQPVLFHGNTTSTTRSTTGTTKTVTVTQGAPGPAPDDIISFRPDARVGTQRRRLR